MKDLQNDKVEYHRSYSLHGLLDVQVKGNEIVIKTTDAEFKDIKHNESSIKKISLNVGTKIDLSGDLTMLGDGMYYLENKDMVITSINHEGISLNPNEVELAIEGDPLSSTNNHISISTSRTIPYDGGLSGTVSKLVADIKSETIPHIAKDKEERWAGLLISSVLEPLLYFTLPTLNHTFIHAAGLINKDKGLLIIGHSNVGKTSLALEMVMNGYSFLGDDLTILSNKGEILSFPKPVKLEGHNITERPEILSKIKENMGTNEKLFFKILTSYLKKKSRSISASVNIEDVLEKPVISSSHNINHVIHIKRYSGDSLIVKEMTLEESVKEAALNLFWEFECQEYRYTKPFYAFKRAHGDDYMKYLEEHHNHIMNIISKSFSKTKSHLIKIPAKSTTDDIYKAVEKLQTS